MCNKVQTQRQRPIPKSRFHTISNVKCQLSDVIGLFPVALFPCPELGFPTMKGRPLPTETAPYYFRYIDLVGSDDPLTTLAEQVPETQSFFATVSEEKSLHRYAADKWSIRQVLSHVNDAERVFLFRALWFARGFEEPLPSYDQEVSAQTAKADDISWSSHLEEFRSIRSSTLAFFRNLPEDAWLRKGIASGNPFTVRALAYILAGHVMHHTSVLRERYL